VIEWLAMAATLAVDLTLRARIRASKLLMLIFFVQLMVAVSVVVFGYQLMKTMSLFDDVVRDAYANAYYPGLVVTCGVFACFVNLGAIQVTSAEFSKHGRADYHVTHLPDSCSKCQALSKCRLSLLCPAPRRGH